MRIRSLEDTLDRGNEFFALRGTGCLLLRLEGSLRPRKAAQAEGQADSPGPSVHPPASTLRSLSSGALSSGQANRRLHRTSEHLNPICNQTMLPVFDKLEVQKESAPAVSSAVRGRVSFACMFHARWIELRTNPHHMPPRTTRDSRSQQVSDRTMVGQRHNTWPARILKSEAIRCSIRKQ